MIHGVGVVGVRVGVGVCMYHTPFIPHPIFQVGFHLIYCIVYVYTSCSWLWYLAFQILAVAGHLMSTSLPFPPLTLSFLLLFLYMIG